MDLTTRAHLPAVRFSPRAYMGCGGWDLAQAPEMAVASVNPEEKILARATSRSFIRPSRSMGDCPGIRYEPPIEEEVKLSCGGGGYMPEFMKEKEEDELGRRRVVMGCGDEMCEECKEKQGLGCPKCKRVRQRAMMQEDELRGRLGQIQPLPDMSMLVVSGLAIAGLFYLVTR